MGAHVEVMDLVAQMKAAEQTFVLATVVRTVSVTAAKAGAKAIIRPDGTIVAGWIGGGCAKGAVLKAAREALADGEPRMVSVQPENLLAELGVKPGDTARRRALRQQYVPEQGHDGYFRGARIAASLACHSRRKPGRAVAGNAGAPARLSRHGRSPRGRFRQPSPTRMSSSTVLQPRYLNEARRFVVVSTQGKGDEAALKQAVAVDAEYRAFVGSRRKMAALREKLVAGGVDAAAIDGVKAPAGLDLGAITPEEIAMSILAEITALRRRGQRDANTAARS